MNQSGQLRTKKTFYFFTLSWLLKWTPKLFVGVCVGEHRRQKLEIPNNLNQFELVWTSLVNLESKKDLLLFYYFIIFIIPIVLSVTPVRLTVWSIAYQFVPVCSGFIRFYSVRSCSEMNSVLFDFDRFWIDIRFCLSGLCPIISGDF